MVLNLRDPAQRYNKSLTKLKKLTRQGNLVSVIMNKENQATSTYAFSIEDMDRFSHKTTVWYCWSHR